DRAPGAAKRDVVALQEVADVDHARFAHVVGEMRRDGLAAVFEDGDIELAAAGVIANRNASLLAERDRLVGRHRADRTAEGDGETLQRGETDADAGERA